MRINGNKPASVPRASSRFSPEVFLLRPDIFPRAWKYMIRTHWQSKKKKIRQTVPARERIVIGPLETRTRLFWFVAGTGFRYRNNVWMFTLYLVSFLGKHLIAVEETSTGSNVPYPSGSEPFRVGFGRAHKVQATHRFTSRGRRLSDDTRPEKARCRPSGRPATGLRDLVSKTTLRES